MEDLGDQLAAGRPGCSEVESEMLIVGGPPSWTLSVLTVFDGMLLRGGLRSSLTSFASTPLHYRSAHTPSGPPGKPPPTTSAPKLRSGALAHLIGPRPSQGPVKRQRLRDDLPLQKPGEGSSKPLVRRPLKAPEPGQWSEQSNARSRLRSSQRPEYDLRRGRDDIVLLNERSSTSRPRGTSAPTDPGRPQPQPRARPPFGLRNSDGSQADARSTSIPSPPKPTIPLNQINTSALPPLTRTSTIISANYDTLSARASRFYNDPKRIFRLSAVSAASLPSGGAPTHLPPFSTSSRPFVGAESITSKVDGRAGSGWLYASPGVSRVLVVASKAVSKSAVERRRIMRRTRAALDVVVNRGGVELPFSECEDG